MRRAVDERCVRAEDDLRDADERLQRGHVDGIRRRGRVVVEAPQVMQARVRLGGLREIVRGHLGAEQPPRYADQRTAGMREDEAHVGAPRSRLADDEAGDRAHRVHRILEHLIRHARQQALAARGIRRVHVDDGLAAVELVEHGREARIAEPGVAVAREQAEAVGFQRIERVFDLAQGSVDVGQRQHGEQSEAAFVIADHARHGELVHLARESPRFLRVAEPNAGRRDRQHRRFDADAVELLDGTRRRVVAPRGETRYRRCGGVLGVQAVRESSG